MKKARERLIGALDRNALVLVASICLAGILGIPSILAYAMLVFYLFAYRDSVLTVLLVLFVVNFGAPPFFPDADFVGRWLVLLALFAAVCLRGISRDRTTTARLLVLFITLLIVGGALVSKVPTVSVLKALALGILLVVALFRKKMPGDRNEAWVVNTVFAVILVTSLIEFSVGSGFEKNGRGFQGSLVHPQVMGSFAALSSAWFIGRWFSFAQLSMVEKAFGVISLLMVFGSQSRTGGLALLIGYGIMVCTASLSGRRMSEFLPKPHLIPVGLAMLVAAISFGDLEERFEEFLKKGDEVNLELDEILVVSRGELMEQSLKNFRRNPIMGIGLGIPSIYDPIYVDDYIVRFQGIPISASVEKGFLPTAVLEEIGIIGTSFLVLLVLSISFPIFKYGKPWEIWLFATALLLNAGEASLLSPGGKGLLIWTFIGFCYRNAVYARQAAIRVSDQ